jgi:FkbM family methyltransferase
MARKNNDWLIPALLIGLLAGVSAWKVSQVQADTRVQLAEYFASDGQRELRPFGEKYGPAKFSENYEEWFIRDFFNDRREGVFLDVGAHHHQNQNNTFFLEKELNWSGLAIDALEEFADGYKTHRPRTKFIAMFASDVGDATVQLFVPDANKLVASSNHDFTAARGGPGTERVVPTTTLNSALEQAGISSIDFMTMDIELSEPKALAGFDIDRYQPALVCIEAHPEVRQAILDYFAAHRYSVVGKYLRADSKNLYFQAPNARAVSNDTH